MSYLRGRASAMGCSCAGSSSGQARARAFVGDAPPALPVDRRTLIMALQAQINRFITPPIRVTGTLDPATAGHAAGLMVSRTLQGFVANLGDREAAAQFIEASKTALANAPAYVEKNLEQIIAVLRDFGDYQRKPPAVTQGSSVDTRVLLVAGALGLGALVLFGKKRSRR